jgi:hypothetical protein
MELEPRTDEPIPGIVTAYRLCIVHYDAEVLYELFNELKQRDFIMHLTRVDVQDDKMIAVKDLPL